MDSFLKGVVDSQIHVTKCRLGVNSKHNKENYVACNHHNHHVGSLQRGTVAAPHVPAEAVIIQMARANCKDLQT